MIGVSRSATAAVLLVGVVVVTGCSAPAPSTALVSPGRTPVATAPSQAVPTASVSSSPFPTSSPTATSSPPPSASPSPTADPSPCAVEPQDGRLPSDRLIDVTTTSTPTADLVTFVFDAPTPGVPVGAADGHLEAATGPFVEAGSGEALDVAGERVVLVRFQGMTLFDEAGRPTYDGPRRVDGAGVALRSVVNGEAFEGASGWYIGFDGPGCVTLVGDPRSVTVLIDHGPG